MERLKEIDAFVKDLIKNIPGLIAGTRIEKIENKSSERDLVTEADKAVETYLTKKILERFPGHEILGEETYNPDRKYNKGNLWVIDPIDGTTNFVKQRDDYCTIICYFENGNPLLAYIYEIGKDDLYWAVSGDGVYLNDKRLEEPDNKSLRESIVSTDIRRMFRNRNDLFNKMVNESFGMRSVGTSGLDGSRVLSGRFGAYLNYSGGPWDFAPFFLMGQLLDLVFVKLNGDEVSLDGYSDYIICTKKVYEDFRKIMDELSA